MLVQSREWVSAVGGAPRALVSPGTYARRTEARLKQGYERRRFGLARALSWCSSRLPGCAGLKRLVAGRAPVFWGPPGSIRLLPEAALYGSQAAVERRGLAGAGGGGDAAVLWVNGSALLARA